MKELIKSVESLADKELMESKVKFEKKFNSEHEGYAFIKEEIEETAEELEKVTENLEYLWGWVRSNDTELSISTITNIYKHAINAAAEVIQVAAMCQKFVESFKEE